MKKLKEMKTKNKIILCAIIGVLLVGVIATGVFLLNGGVIKEYVLTGDKASFENAFDAYKPSLQDSVGNTLYYNPENGFVAIKKEDYEIYLHIK